MRSHAESGAPLPSHRVASTPRPTSSAKRLTDTCGPGIALVGSTSTDLPPPQLHAVATVGSSWCWSHGKRTLDLVVAIATLPITVPLTLALSLVSAIRFRCNPFFVQQRRGVGEEPFRVVKIRSLPKHFHGNRGKHELDDHDFEGWSGFLRNSHLDELPQVLNIIGGSMSIVGPRPMIDEVVDTLEPADRQKRALVKPGLTGPWQISTMGAVALHDHPELDNRYVDNATLAADLRIIAITAATVFGRKPMEPDELAAKLRW